MSVCLKSLNIMFPSSNSVEIYTPVSGVSHEQIRVVTLTSIDNKNGWNTSMCSSSTLAINPCVFANYPSKKWNTPVPLFPK